MVQCVRTVAGVLLPGNFLKVKPELIKVNGLKLSSDGRIEELRIEELRIEESRIEEWMTGYD